MKGETRMFSYDNWDDYTPVEYNINHGKNGIELKYINKPSQNTISRLKRNGWKWNNASGVWYKKNSNETLSFAIKECDLTQKRKKMIEKMPKFYTLNCGYTEDTLLRIAKNSFDKIYKTGTLKQIAQELLLEILPFDALGLLREIYLMVLKDENYKKEFIKKIPKELYKTDKDGHNHLVDNPKYKQYPNENDIEYINTELGLKQSGFWQSLELFGQQIQPVNKIAYNVANYRNSYSNAITTYYKPKNRQEYHLYNIINDLTLVYDDLLVRTIKLELKKEKDYILDNNNPDEIDYYLLSLYSFLSDTIEDTKKVISTYIDKRTPKDVILSVNKRKKSLNAKESIKKIVFREFSSMIDYDKETAFFVKGSTITIEEKIVVGLTEEIYKYNLSYETWLKFFTDFVKHKFLSMKQEEFEASYSDEYILNDTSYDLDIYLSNDTNIHYDGNINDKGVKLFIGMLYTYVIRPDNADRILRKRDLSGIDIW